jgi:hypothetical protein
MSKRGFSASSQKGLVGSQKNAFSYVAVDTLAANPLNPRLHNHQQVVAIARSIETFGFNAPILVDSKNRVVAGHGRLEAAKWLKLESVPVIRLAHLTEAQAKAYMLADNKLTDRSSWDDRRVAIVLKELSEIALDFDIEATGFEPPEIDLRIQSLGPPDATDAADEFEAPEGPTVSQPGDLWVLDRHRLFCGSALDSHAYGALLGAEKAAAVFTDPPYNVPVRGVSGKGAKRHREFPMASGEMTEDEFGRFLEEAFSLMISHSVDGATFFACMDWRHVYQIIGAIRVLNCELLNVCVWVKTNGGMAHYTARVTNSCSSLASGARSASTMSSLGDMDATERMSGTIRA